MNNYNDNILIHKEEPNFTKEERIIYFKLMIEEADKRNLPEIANYYKILLKMIEKDSNDIYNFLSKKTKN